MTNKNKIKWKSSLENIWDFEFDETLNSYFGTLTRVWEL